MEALWVPLLEQINQPVELEDPVRSFGGKNQLRGLIVFHA